jgi:effector-binding domain-containing protein
MSPARLIRSLAVAAVAIAAAGLGLAPVRAQTPAIPPAAQASDKPADPFGQELTLTARTVVILKGTANWDAAFETLVATFKKVYAALDKQGVAPAGPAMTVYTSTDDTGFTFEAQVPVSEPPKNLPKDIVAGKSPEGKALKFVHRGSYDSMDNTYEAITNHLEEKKLESQDMFIEEYVTDVLKTPEDKMVINVYVPLK